MTEKKAKVGRPSDSSEDTTEKPTRGPGAPLGNKNSSKANRLWGDTIRRALAQDKDPNRLRRLAEALIAKAEDGDLGALKEIGDRLDGKPAQQVIVNGDEEGGAIQTELTVRFIAPE